MFIQTEDTPNPQTIKFIPGLTILENGTMDFPSKKEAGTSPLAETLFNVEQVERVFLGKDFISVTKSPEANWKVLKPEILAAIMDHFVAGKPVLADQAANNASFTKDENEPPIVQQIRELIETRVRPAVAQDGGDIIYRDFKDGIVYLELRGSCSGCPSSTLTLKQGVENMLKHYVPEVVAVESIAA